MTMNQVPHLGPSQSPPGWFPDVTPGLVRYWDGSKWTEHVAPASPPSAPPLAQPETSLSTAGKVAVAAAVAALIGSFLPWVSIVSIFGSIEVSGFTAGDGKLTAGAAVIAMLLGYLGLTKGNNGPVVLAILAALGGAIASIYDLTNIQNAINGSESEGMAVTVGYGLYLCSAGFVVCFFALLNARSRAS
jgi:hypothetical protein